MITLTIAKVAFVLMAAGWYLIRFPHARRSRRTPISRSARGVREIALLLVSLTGLGILPFLYVFTGVFRFANYPFQPTFASAGLLLAIGALTMFYLTHSALGRNWSVTLEVRQSHKLVTDGIYERVRHPMYTAFWLWALAQALLLPNWIAGFSGILGFGTLYFLRIRHEECLMIEAFGDSYRSYMARTTRLVPKVF